MTPRGKFSYVSWEMEQRDRKANVARLGEIADQIERDLHEPDKVLCAVQNLRRLALDMELPLPILERS